MTSLFSEHDKQCILCSSKFSKTLQTEFVCFLFVYFYFIFFSTETSDFSQTNNYSQVIKVRIVCTVVALSAPEKKTVIQTFRAAIRRDSYDDKKCFNITGMS